MKRSASPSACRARRRRRASEGAGPRRRAFDGVGPAGRASDRVARPCRAFARGGCACRASGRRVVGHRARSPAARLDRGTRDGRREPARGGRARRAVCGPARACESARGVLRRGRRRRRGAPDIRRGGGRGGGARLRRAWCCAAVAAGRSRARTRTASMRGRVPGGRDGAGTAIAAARWVNHPLGLCEAARGCFTLKYGVNHPHAAQFRRRGWLTPRFSGRSGCPGPRDRPNPSPHRCGSVLQRHLRARAAAGDGQRDLLRPAQGASRRSRDAQPDGGGAGGRHAPRPASEQLAAAPGDEVDRLARRACGWVGTPCGEWARVGGACRASGWVGTPSRATGRGGPARGRWPAAPPHRASPAAGDVSCETPADARRRIGRVA